MISINSIQFNVPVEAGPTYPDEGKIDVKACLTSTGFRLDGVKLEIDQKLLYETNEEREFEVDDEEAIITHRIAGDLERLPSFITVDVYLHQVEDTGQDDPWLS